MTSESTAKRMEEGEVIEGTVTELDKSWSDYQNGYVPVVVIRQKNGQLRTVIAFHEILRRKLISHRPRIGDPLKITCHGEQPTKDGKRTVTLYSVEGGQEQDADTFWREQAAQTQPAPTNTNAEVDSDIPF